MIRILLFLAIILTTSCSDTINTDEQLLNNIIVMEDQVQRMNGIQFDRGQGYLMDIKAELAVSKVKSEKLSHIYEKMLAIDLETSSVIGLIEQIKLDLLQNAGESTKENTTKNPSSIVWRKYDSNYNGCLPSQLHLNAINNKRNIDITTSYFVDSDGLKPSQKGLELWNAINSFRNNIVKHTGSYSWNEKEYNVSPKNINTFSNNQDLLKKVSDMINNSNCNSNEDTYVLIDLYMNLTKPENIQYSDETVHWISSIFRSSPLVSAIATLSSLEQDVLSARALALAHWKSKISVCGYTFNSIVPLAIGPSTCIDGEEIQIKVIMAAFDSDNQPVVTTTAGNSTIKYNGDGVGLVSLKPKSGLNTYKGTVSIKNKAGTVKTEKWEWTVNVLPE